MASMYCERSTLGLCRLDISGALETQLKIEAVHEQKNVASDLDLLGVPFRPLNISDHPGPIRETVLG